MTNKFGFGLLLLAVVGLLASLGSATQVTLGTAHKR